MACARPKRAKMDGEAGLSQTRTVFLSKRKRNELVHSQGPGVVCYKASWASRADIMGADAVDFFKSEQGRNELIHSQGVGVV